MAPTVGLARTFHEAISKKNVEMMAGLFAPNATGTFGPGKTVTGRDQIRGVWLKSVAWKPETHWLSDHPAYKLKVTVDGAGARSASSATSSMSTPGRLRR